MSGRAGSDARARVRAWRVRRRVGLRRRAACYTLEGSVAETRVEIPDREWFKPSEVCEIASLQPYVLRSWEVEFPGLGIQRAAGSPRVYRRSDVERVLRIRELVFGEGLTLAGARRRIEGEGRPLDEDDAQLVDGDTRARLAAIRQELRALHEWLSSDRRESTGGEPQRAEGVQAALPDLDGERGRTQSWPPKRPSRRKSKGRS